MESLFATIFSLILFFSDVLLIVMSGVGYSYFDSDILLGNYRINQRLMFGFGIGVGLIEFFGIILFLADTDFKINYFITIPVFVVMSSLYIAYSRPNYYKKYIDHYNKQWDGNSTKYINFQWKRSCCGYYKFNDRGIPNCPFEFTSGCSFIISDYLKPRFKEIFISSIVVLCLFLISIIGLIIYYYVEDSSSILEDIYILCDIF